MTTFTVTTTDRQPAAVMRAEVPMEGLRNVFDRGFGEVVRVAEAQGLAITGPPFGLYPRMPTDTVEVAVGFPVSDFCRLRKSREAVERADERCRYLPPAPGRLSWR